MSAREITQRSFSIIDDDDEDVKEEPQLYVDKPENLSGSESEDNPIWSRKSLSGKKPEVLPRQRLLSAGPSKKPPQSKVRNLSDSEESDDDSKRKTLPGEYDPKLYEDLTVDEDVKDVFQYIIKYTPQHLNTEYKFKPFVPDFLPAVGDIDAFLKVVPPETTLSGEIYEESVLQLGLLVLDEPAANQSDPALLQLQLRAGTDNLSVGDSRNVVVKKIANTEKNSKVIDKWVKDVSHLHRSKSSPVVRYSQPMPDLDDLMQEWPDDVEKRLKEEGFPKPDENTPLSDYVDTVCGYFQIPVGKNRIHSLHLLFCLYSAIKQTQLYQKQAASNIERKKHEAESKSQADQLVLD